MTGEGEAREVVPGFSIADVEESMRALASGGIFFDARAVLARGLAREVVVVFLELWEEREQEKRIKLKFPESASSVIGADW